MKKLVGTKDLITRSSVLNLQWGKAQYGINVLGMNAIALAVEPSSPVRIPFGWKVFRESFDG